MGRHFEDQLGIKPGMTESVAIRMAQEILAGMGSRKFWHNCHIRFGADTVLSFNDGCADRGPRTSIK